MVKYSSNSQTPLYEYNTDYIYCAILDYIYSYPVVYVVVVALISDKQ